jgi:hypothetical protein
MSITVQQSVTTSIRCDGPECKREWQIIESATGVGQQAIPQPPVVIGEDFDKTRVVILQDGNRKYNYCGSRCEQNAIEAGQHNRQPKPGAALAALRESLQAKNAEALTDAPVAEVTPEEITPMPEPELPTLDAEKGNGTIEAGSHS